MTVPKTTNSQKFPKICNSFLVAGPRVISIPIYEYMNSYQSNPICHYHPLDRLMFP